MKTVFDFVKFFIILISLFSIGCTGMEGRQNEAAGGVIGAVIGGVAGSQVGGGSGRTAAIITGSILGGFIGSSIGKSMDDVDRMKANQALETMPTGRSSKWINPDSGNSFEVTPSKTMSDEHRPCREYTMNSTIDGQPEFVKGTACRNDNGEWIQQ